MYCLYMIAYITNINRNKNNKKHNRKKTVFLQAIYKLKGLENLKNVSIQHCRSCVRPIITRNAETHLNIFVFMSCTM